MLQPTPSATLRKWFTAEGISTPCIFPEDPEDLVSCHCSSKACVWIISDVSPPHLPSSLQRRCAQAIVKTPARRPHSRIAAPWFADVCRACGVACTPSSFAAGSCKELEMQESCFGIKACSIGWTSHQKPRVKGHNIQLRGRYKMRSGMAMETLVLHGRMVSI